MTGAERGGCVPLSRQGEEYPRPASWQLASGINGTCDNIAECTDPDNECSMGICSFGNCYQMCP